MFRNKFLSNRIVIMTNELLRFSARLKDLDLHLRSWGCEDARIA